MSGWNGFENIKAPDNPHDGGSGGGSGEVPKELITHVKNHDVHLDSKEQKEQVLTKDILFNMLSPLKIGPVKETELLIPLKGTITSIVASLSMDSFISSNLIIGIQKYDGRNWQNVQTLNIQVYEKSITIPTDININNNILRIVLVDGSFANVNSLNIIIKLKEE